MSISKLFKSDKLGNAMILAGLMFLGVALLIAFAPKEEPLPGITENDWLVCGASLNEAQLGLSWDEMFPICIELFETGVYFIEDKQLTIKFARVGDTVKIPLI